MADLTSQNQLMQFLMGLISNAYDHLRNQILVMDPLPSVKDSILDDITGGETDVDPNGDGGIE